MCSFSSACVLKLCEQSTQPHGCFFRPSALGGQGHGGSVASGAAAGGEQAVGFGQRLLRRRETRREAWIEPGDHGIARNGEDENEITL